MYVNCMLKLPTGTITSLPYRIASTLSEPLSSIIKITEDYSTVYPTMTAGSVVVLTGYRFYTLAG